MDSPAKTKKRPRRQAGGPAMLRVTKFGDVQIGPAPSSGPVTIDDWREMLRISAELVEELGKVALPLFERCERELAEAETRSSAMERAKAVARRHRESKTKGGWLGEPPWHSRGHCSHALSMRFPMGRGKFTIHDPSCEHNASSEPWRNE